MALEMLQKSLKKKCQQQQLLLLETEARGRGPHMQLSLIVRS